MARRQPMTLADLFEVNPAARVFAVHFRENEFGVLEGLWEVGGRKPGMESTRWLGRQARQVVGRVMALEGRIIADDEAAWRYLLDTDQEVRRAYLGEYRRTVVADPVGAVIASPSVIPVTLARSVLVNDMGLADDAACRLLIGGAIERTRDLPEHRRETIVTRIQRAVRAVEASPSRPRARAASPRSDHPAHAPVHQKGATMDATTSEEVAPARKRKPWKATEAMREASRRNGRAAVPKAAAAALANARAFQEDIAPTAVERYRAGVSLQAVADSLNEDGFRTRRGCLFTKMAVRRILNRANALRQASGQDQSYDLGSRA